MEAELLEQPLDFKETEFETESPDPHREFHEICKKIEKEKDKKVANGRAFDSVIKKLENRRAELDAQILGGQKILPFGDVEGEPKPQTGE